MARGDVLAPGVQRSLEQAVARAESAAPGVRFSVYVGELPEGRASARARHADLSDPAASVLIAVDPGARAVEIVTGTRAAKVLDDDSCALAILAMTSSFSAGNLVGGLRAGLTLLGEHARV